MAKTSKPGSKVKPQADRTGKKKTASAGTTNAKPSQKAALGGVVGQVAVRDFEPADTPSYLGLRQSLDSFQAVALYYYTCGEDTQQRAERAEEIKSHIRSFRHEGPGLDPDPDRDCPPGTRACAGGDCVPIAIGCVQHDDE